MAVTAKVYKHGIELGSASATGGSATLSTYTGTSLPIGKNVQVVVTSGDNAGLQWAARVIANNGSGTITLNEKCPVVE